MLEFVCFVSQIEHHLFPQVCTDKLPYLVPVVKATCEEFGIEVRTTLHHPAASASLLYLLPCRAMTYALPTLPPASIPHVPT